MIFGKMNISVHREGGSNFEPLKTHHLEIKNYIVSEKCYNEHNANACSFYYSINSINKPLEETSRFYHHEYFFALLSGKAQIDFNSELFTDKVFLK
jgi:hypothetical protein